MKAERFKQKYRKDIFKLTPLELMKFKKLILRQLKDEINK